MKVANFLFSGIRFEVIEDISAYVKRYARLLAEDPRIAAYGNFDVSVIKPPAVKDGMALFYVEEIATGLPYRVQCSYPYTDARQPFVYTLLPYKR